MIQEFTAYIIKQLGYSQQTAIAYGKDLHAFATWMREQRSSASWSSVTKTDIDDYVCKLHDEELANSTITRKVSAIRSFYNYAKVRGLRNDNPARFVSSPKIAKKLPNTIEQEAIKQVLASPGTSAVVRAYVALMYETGMRLQEVLDLDTHDVIKAERAIVVHGKGNKERKVYYGELTAQMLNAYLGTRRGKVFYNTQREVRDYIYQAFRPYSDARQLSPHALRHTFASVMLQQGANIKVIQSLLGHESVKTTERYAQIANAQRASEYKLYKPTL